MNKRDSERKKSPSPRRCWITSSTTPSRWPESIVVAGKSSWTFARSRSPWEWKSCAKTPAMVRTELWSCLLAYNLIRESMLHAATEKGRPCRSLSLTATLQMIGNLWLANAMHEVNARLPALFRTHQVKLKVGNRPGRNEPRVNKRRPKMLKLMTEPRPKKLAAAAA